MVRSYVLEVRLVNWRTCHFTRRSFRVELAARKYYCTAHIVETRLHSVYILFAAPRCASAVYYAMALCPSVSVRLSVASRCSTKMAKHRITQTKPHDSRGILVFWCQRSYVNSTGASPGGGAKCRWGKLKSATFEK